MPGTTLGLLVAPAWRWSQRNPIAETDDTLAALGMTLLRYGRWTA